MGDNETIKVAVRIRPLTKTEKANHSQAVDYRTDGNQLYFKDYGFEFDHLFGPEFDQDRLYSSIRETIIPKLFSGLNFTVLAYGQTGSGKTYTIGTNYLKDSNMGITQRVLTDIFEEFEKNSTVDYKLTVTFIEVYNETIYDLLTDESRENATLEIREENREFKCVGVTEKRICSVADGFELLKHRSKLRSVAATNMNESSSRSHAILTFNLSFRAQNDPHLITSKFQLVDLAGSERQKKVDGQSDGRFKEDVNINLSLLALGNVISALNNETGNKGSFVSYRDSKLTRLLQNSFGGNSVTLMIACISSAVLNLEESLSTLRYVDKVKKIRNKPIVNKCLQTNELSDLKSHIKQLEAQIEQFKAEKTESNDTSTKQNGQELKENIFSDEIINIINSLKETSKELVYSTNENVSVDRFKQTMSTLMNLFERFLNEKSELDEKLTVNKYENEIQARQKEFWLVQCKSQMKLEEIDEKIKEKQDEIGKLEKRANSVHELKQSIMESKFQLQKFKLEYDGIAAKIQENKANKTVSKMNIARRLRQTELEVLMNDLKSTIRDEESRARADSDFGTEIDQLQEQIQDLKKEKVDVVKHLQVETQQFKLWRAKKDKQIEDLKKMCSEKVAHPHSYSPKKSIKTEDYDIVIKYSSSRQELVDFAFEEKHSKDLQQIIKQLEKFCKTVPAAKSNSQKSNLDQTDLWDMYDNNETECVADSSPGAASETLLSAEFELPEIDIEPEFQQYETDAQKRSKHFLESVQNTLFS